MLPNLKNKKTVFLAVGNIMRGDDAFGPVLYDLLAARANKNFLPLNGGEMPESFTSKIKAFAPDYLIIADAVAAPVNAPAWAVLGEGDITGASLSTHTMPLDIMIKFLKEDLPALEIIFIAAAAQNTDFGTPPNPRIKTAAREAAAVILKSLTST